MSDFVQKANVKRLVCTLTTKIADVATSNTIVKDVIDTNAFSCVDHVVSGVTIWRVLPVAQGRSVLTWCTKTRQPYRRLTP